MNLLSIPPMVWYIGAGVIAVGVLMLIIVLILKGKKKAKSEQPTQNVEAQPVETLPVEVEEVAVEQTAEEEAAEEEAEERVNATKTPAERAVAESKVYHISKRKEDGKWQVKLAKGAKAIKLFNTQLEAIEFAKARAASQEGRIVIHKEDGGFRKLTYKKKK